MRIPITLITGFLGSGKTTLGRHIVETAREKIAILVNEFGELAVDGEIIRGKNIAVAELSGGCVCCSLTGEFDAAVEELLTGVAPDRIVVETTGVAEPDALVFNLQDSLPRVRLDGVATVCDADAMVRFPELGRTTRMQIEAADLILLNKIDLVRPSDLPEAESKLAQINGRAIILRADHCRVDPDQIFGAGRRPELNPPEHIHQPEFESFVYEAAGKLDLKHFSEFADRLGDPFERVPQQEDMSSDSGSVNFLTGKTPGADASWRGVYRAKGFIDFPEGSKLFNFVAGRWELEDLDLPGTRLVFIGKSILSRKREISAALEQCKL
jgi:G3E family GTPase